MSEPTAHLLQICGVLALNAQVETIVLKRGSVEDPDVAADHVGSGFGGSAVHPDFRGNWLQLRMTDMRHRYALAHDRYQILGTVSPLNPVSLSNFLGFGCRVKKFVIKYNDMQRFIIHRDLRDEIAPEFDPATLADIPLGDIERHKALLRQGFHGYRVVPGVDEAHLRYGRPQASGALSAFG